MMPRLNQNHCNVAVQLLLGGSAQGRVVGVLRVHHGTTSRLYQCLQQIATTANRPLIGRARVTMQRQDQYIHLSYLRR